MNRRILIQVTTPALLIGLLLLLTCLASAWYIHRLQTNLDTIRLQDVASLQAALDLEMSLRQLRYHDFLYLGDPQVSRLTPILADRKSFAKALHQAQQSARSPEEFAYLREIEEGYGVYDEQLARLRAVAKGGGKSPDFQQLVQAHAEPVRRLIKSCEQLLQINQNRMQETAKESAYASEQARLAMLLLGFGGPVGGLICGYGIARGLSRSIYRLSVRVQDITQRLDQDVASVSVAADGDIATLDRQLQHVIGRVEEVAERVQRHQREMWRAEQLSAVGQLAASVAHEVRNPLTSVKLLVESARRDPDQHPLTKEDLDVIYQEVVRLEQTVQGFLNFARLPLPQRSTVNLRDVLAQALELVRARARQQQVEVRCRHPNEPLWAEVDRGQVCTVLVNLFLNALDAMPHGGELEVALDTAPEGSVRVCVEDSGTGIAPEMTGRLFTPFASTKPTGTGLGLSISQRIIEDHGGRITATNRAPSGASFTIVLPAMRADDSLRSTGDHYADPIGHR